MHRSFLVALAVGMLFGCVGQSMAADGNLSQSMLTDMGLSGVQEMSDVQGEEIRGKGFVRACGRSMASVYGYGAMASSTNKYIVKGNKFAWGKTKSWAIVVSKWSKLSKRGHSFSKSRHVVAAAAGGYSKGYRW